MESALATDFAWAKQHAVIAQRLDRWKSLGQHSRALLRGEELAELMAAALIDEPGREPTLTDEQRRFLYESQRHEGIELDPGKALTGVRRGVRPPSPHASAAKRNRIWLCFLRPRACVLRRYPKRDPRWSRYCTTTPRSPRFFMGMNAGAQFRA